MVNLKVKLDQGVPQYCCNSCSNCQSIHGKSLCSIKNRGCCWYFPKFTLHEIHRMVKDDEGLKALGVILKLPEVKVYNYFIHSKGYFDERGYKKYLESEQAYDTDLPDKSIFFRACPFVESGIGCTLPEKYRSYICNFYICDEIAGELKGAEEFKRYIKERDSYVKWLEWENNSLEILLKEKKINLVSNFYEVINLLKDLPLENYEFPSLPPIERGNDLV
jgi:hypothetical protein